MDVVVRCAPRDVGSWPDPAHAPVFGLCARAYRQNGWRQGEADPFAPHELGRAPPCRIERAEVAGLGPCMRRRPSFR